MMMLAFPLAEKYRNPVMILGDGLIGQMMEPVEFPDHLKTEPIEQGRLGHQRHGHPQEHDGAIWSRRSIWIPEELNAHNLKLKAKYDRMKQEEVRCETYNLDGDYRVLIVSYGTMSRVCRTAIDNLKEKGVEVGMIRPQTLFPFPRQAIYEAAAKTSCQAVISIEMSMGQMVEDVERSVQGPTPVHWYGKCGGEVPTPEEVMEVFEADRFVTNSNFAMDSARPTQACRLTESMRI